MWHFIQRCVWCRRAVEQRASFQAVTSKWRQIPNMTSNSAISWPTLSQSRSLGPSTLNSLIKICLLSRSKWHLTRLAIFQQTVKTFLRGLIPFFRHFSGAQVTFEPVSHELSSAIWKQNDWRGDKRFIPVCFALPGQLKVNVLRSFFRKCSPFLMCGEF